MAIISMRSEQRLHKEVLGDKKETQRHPVPRGYKYGNLELQIRESQMRQ
jgi:hypothetical protein